ncbi:DUF6286 domain-containing protein [Streptomyces sp. NPDC046821]|uniref:DUF6286 domain-containing protein n=1 Tax=Streptomyces sp. NPDC046821 TaxID=3154702 RepID=UPI00340C669F
MSEPTQPLPVVEREADGPPGGFDQSGSAATYEGQPPHRHRADGRFWSPRRIPAALVAAVLVGGAGILLYDIASVRAGHPAMQWRRSLANELAQRPLNDVWVLTGAGVAAALGLWLVVLAVTPGLRAVLTMRRAHTDVRAGLHRDAAAMVLRDRAMEVSGVQSVRVRVKRRKAEVRAVSHFRQLDDVRADLDTVIGRAVDGLGLAVPPALSVRVVRPGKKG